MAACGYLPIINTVTMWIRTGGRAVHRVRSPLTFSPIHSPIGQAAHGRPMGPLEVERVSAAKLTRASHGGGGVVAGPWRVCREQYGGSSSGGSSPSSGINLPALTTLNVPADAANPAGDGKAKCSGAEHRLRRRRDRSERAARPEHPVRRQTALDAHNTANPGCQVQLKKFDTQGSSSVAPGLVTQLASEQDIIGAVGLAFSGESAATGRSSSRRAWCTSPRRRPTRR